MVNGDSKSNYLVDGMSSEETFDVLTTNNIYVYMGARAYSGDYDIVHGRSVIEISANDPNFDWKEYRNIRLGYNDSIGKNECRDFEAENIVLVAPKGVEPIEFYRQVKKVFFETLDSFNQEVAVEKVKNEFGNTILEPTGPILEKK